MAKTSALHMRIDTDLKNDTECLLKQLGMTPAEAVSIFFSQLILNQGLPFPVKIPKYNRETLEAMEESKKIVESGKSRFESVEEMFEDLEI